MSYPQPGPYGQQPPPNPYGQGGAPGQPGYGYPQQPPAPYGAPPPPPPPPGTPYGAPPQQAGWGQPQAPQPQGWGQQPGMPGGYPPQPRGGGAGKAIGITVGVLVVVGAIVGGVLFLNGGGGSGGDVKPYKMEMPESLLDGKFVKGASAPGASNKESEDITDDKVAKEMGISNGTGVKASYTSPEKQMLSVVGAYGELTDPNKTVDAMIAKMDEGAKQNEAAMQGKGAQVETITPWTEFSPSGFDGAVMKCETKKSSFSMGTMSSAAEVSVCIWGDSSAVGITRHVVSKTTNPYGGSATSATGNVMSAKDFSEATAKIRNQVRKEK
ncbi:hypothetical protein [Streptomyces sp. NPDC000405]|uniref:hypothetical protein n=1 Tax=Streptomyces sp. NPDC000405 TaxID=3161033 RepID=UPI00398CAAC2